jgi:Ca2+-binding EF-hand superfamily protein
MEKSKTTDTASEARRIFDQFDLDRSGSIDDTELRLAIASMAPGLPVRSMYLCKFMYVGRWRS